MAQCKKGAEQKQGSLAADEEMTITSREFSDYGRSLEMVKSFRYLGRVMLATDDHWKTVVWNLTKARAMWRRMTRILSREEERPRVSGFFFKSVSQSVLLFGTET